MALNLVAVGTRMPAWVSDGVQEYGKRMPAELALNWREVKTETRNKSVSIAQCLSREAARLQAAIPKQSHVVLLDEHGQACTTVKLSAHLARWQSLGSPISIIIGGPDGVDPTIKQMANETLRLSDLTLPHPVVRVLLAEQLYRAWTILTHHPYHRA